MAEALRRGRLSEAERGDLKRFLSSHPDQQSTWEEELELNRLLDQLPPAPLSSNFTAQVLQQARQVEAPRRLAGWVAWRGAAFRGWLPKVATLAAALGMVWFTYHQHQLAQRRELAQNLVEFSRLASNTPVEVLQNFDVIQRLDQVPRDVDRELLAALQVP